MNKSPACAREEDARLVESFAWLVYEETYAIGDLSPDMILCGGIFKHRKLSAARQKIALALRRQTPASYPAIGRLFGMHHTSVMLMCRRAKAELERTEVDDDA